jgi:hypothetical protein
MISLPEMQFNIFMIWSLQSIPTELAKLYSRKVISRVTCPANAAPTSGLDDQNSLTRIEALGNRARWKRKRKGRAKQNGQLAAVRRQIGMAQSQSSL